MLSLYIDGLKTAFQEAGCVETKQKSIRDNFAGPVGAHLINQRWRRPCPARHRLLASRRPAAGQQSRGWPADCRAGDGVFEGIRLAAVPATRDLLA
jgi:hypothetical protein